MKNRIIFAMSFLPAKIEYNDFSQLIAGVGNYFSEPEAIEIILTKWHRMQIFSIKERLRNRLRYPTIFTAFKVCEKYGFSGNYSDLKAYRSNYKPDEVKIDLTRFERPKQQNGERLFQISYNPKACDVNPNFYDHKELVSGFLHLETPLRGLPLLIRSGSIISNSQFGDYRKSENFISADSLMLDFDCNEADGIERFLSSDLAKVCDLIYTTKTHTPEKPRFRAFCGLPRVITDGDVYKEIITKFIERAKTEGLKPDEAPKSVCQGWFTNPKAEIYIKENNIFKLI